MSSLLPSCPGCRTPLGERMFNLPDLAPCPVVRGPAASRGLPGPIPTVRPAGADGEALMVEGESSCFYHPQKKAVVPCQGCGRFPLRALRLRAARRAFLSGLPRSGRQKGRIKRLENQRTLYDGIALGVATLPLLIFYFTIITAPIALYLAIRYWNAPRSIVHRTKIRLVLAILLATAPNRWAGALASTSSSPHFVPMAEQQYRRLTWARRRQSGFVVFTYIRSSLWLGADHLLGIDSNGLLRDLQTVLLPGHSGGDSPANPAAHDLELGAGSAHRPFRGGLGLRTGAQPEHALGGLVPWVVITLILAIPLLMNNLLGPTCVCRLRTAVQTEELPSLCRLRQTRKILNRLRPLIAAAQGELAPEEIPARMQAWATAASAPSRGEHALRG